MSDVGSVFVRQDLVPERAAPVKTTGFIGFLRTRLFNSPTNILITIVSTLLLWFIVVPALRFLLVDAVWTGADRSACLAENVGRPDIWIWSRSQVSGHSSQEIAVLSRTISLPSNQSSGPMTAVASPAAASLRPASPML